MHTVTKDVVTDDKIAKEMSVPVGTHIVTITSEADGASELASDKATISAKIIKSPKRTDSGGFELQVAIFVSEPTPAVQEKAPEVKESTPEEQAVSYFVEKGMKEDTAKVQVARFGVSRVLAMRDKELDEQLAALVAKDETPSAT